MQGLRKQETEKFNAFFRLVQAEVLKLNSVFFLDAAMGKFVETKTMECADMCGWLIPFDTVNEFEDLFMQNSPKQHEFDDSYCFVDFNIENNGNVEIEIDNTPNDLIVDDFNIISKGVEVRS